MDIVEYCKNNRIEWAFFDCFDTLLHRLVLEEERDYKWAEKVSNKCSLFSSALLIDIRQDILKAFHQKGIFNYNYFDIMEEVYTRLLYAQTPSFSVGKQEFLEIATSVEVDLERSITTVDKENLEILRKLAEIDVKIAVVSDFYIGMQGLREILSDKSVLLYVERIFVSCDYKKRKSDGDLYQEVLKTLNISGEKCIMLGDDISSDVKRAQEHGIKAFFRPYRSTLLSPMSRIHQIHKRNIKDPIPGLHYSYSIYLFFCRLYKRLREINQCNIFFLAREGEFLKEAFDSFLKAHEETTIQTHYLYVSRKSTLMPSLKPIEEETFERIFRQTKTLSIRDFLRALTFSEPDQNRVYQSLTQLDYTTTCQNFDCSEGFLSLIRNPVFLELYESKRQSTRGAFISYMSSFCVDIFHDDLVLVDVGWRGTIQDNIYHVFEGIVKVRGFYIGLTGTGDLLHNNLKEGLLFSVAPIKTPNYGVWLNREFYERLMRASHGMTIGYAIERDFAVPILEEVNTEIDAYHYARPTQKKIIATVDAIAQVLRFYVNDDRYIEKILLPLEKKVVLCVSRKDLQFERRLFDLNKESFLPVWEKSSQVDVIMRVLAKMKYIIKNIFNLEFYNGSFAIYNFSPCFVMLWGRLIYWKQKMRGEL